MDRPIESHGGAQENIIMGPVGRKFLNFSFLKWHILVYFIYLGDNGPQTLQGPG